MSDPLPWPSALAGTPAVAVIERAIEKQRLSHSLLLTGDDLDTLVAVAHAIADRLLHTQLPPDARRFPPLEHPDCFTLRPAGKTRQISADATRQLIAKVQVSGAVSSRKVAIIHEADRMHVAAANIFLKTLEEPPARTTLLLITTRPYALLPTIRSRVLAFRFPSGTAGIQAEGWNAWLDDYRAWLGRLQGGVSGKQSVADHVFTVYGLGARFSAILDAATAEIWKVQKEKLPAELDDDEQTAIEAGISNGLRNRFFVEIEQATRTFALPLLESAPEPARRALVASIRQLEHDVGLLRLNLNEAAALEDFLLSSLRVWTKK